jgi:nucleotide-binding universal stress UspA family protein
MLPEIKKILYTTNLSDGTRPVLRFAIGLAKTHQAKLHLLHVIEPLSDSGRLLIETYMSKEVADQAEELGRTLHEESSRQLLAKMESRVHRFCEEELGASPNQLDFFGDVKIVSGSPAEVIVHEAESRAMDLIVVGSHTGSSFKTALLGSTARRVTLMSSKPVLLVPMAKASSWGDE